MKVVIVGGVAGGASAAARIRRLDEDASIIIFERSGFISYANCGLPYYVGGVIRNKDELTLQTPESFKMRFNIDVRVRHEVISVNTHTKTVTVHNIDTDKTFEESYDKLVLAPGARPTVPDLPGIDNNRIFTLRSVEDTFKIKEFIERIHPRKAVVIGGGFIGLESAENLLSSGVEVTLIEYADHVLAQLDFDMACFVHSAVIKNGISLRLGTAVTGFTSRGSNVVVNTSDGSSVEADMVLLAVGVTPDTALAAKAGLKLGAKGSISVNEMMETSAADVYAVGDAVEITNFVTGLSSLVPLAGPANKQGRIAADNICGGHSVYKGAQGSSIIKVFDMTAAVTGLNENAAKRAGIPYEKIVISPLSHASYYPGGTVMTIKALYDRQNGKLIGAQIVGLDGVDKRIDVLATAIRAGMKITDLIDLDLAYAPPYSSAKDPVNMTGYVAENVLTGKVKQFHYDQLDVLPRDGSVFLMDTRTQGEYLRGHVEGFINIPVDDLRERIGEIPKGKPVYVMCQSGLRSYLACRILSQRGYDCYNFSGGYRFYDAVMKGRIQANHAYPCGMESDR